MSSRLHGDDGEVPRNASPVLTAPSVTSRSTSSSTSVVHFEFQPSSTGACISECALTTAGICMKSVPLELTSHWSRSDVGEKRDGDIFEHQSSCCHYNLYKRVSSALKLNTVQLHSSNRQSHTQRAHCGLAESALVPRHPCKAACGRSKVMLLGQGYLTMRR